MTKEQDKIWQDKFKNNETVFVHDDFEDVIIKFVPADGETVCFAKRPGQREYLIDLSSDLAMNARMGGDFVNEKFYNEF